MGHGQWISQMFAGSSGMVRLENRFWARCWKDAVVWWIYTRCPSYSLFPDSPSPNPVFFHPKLLTPLLFSFSVTVSASHAFNFNPTFLTKKSYYLPFRPPVPPHYLFLVFHSCSGLPTDWVPTVSIPAYGLLPEFLGSAPSSAQHCLSGNS